MMGKLEDTISRLNNWFEQFERPVMMSSFGKDSMVMFFIVFRLMKKRMPIIYHGVPWEPWKNDFAWSIIKLFRLEVYDYPPIMSGIKVKPELLEIVHRYQIGGDPGKGIDIPVNIEQMKTPLEFKNCGLAMLERPKGAMSFPWNLILIGHKDCDVDQFDGPVPLKAALIKLEGLPATAFPLKEWTDDDVWDFIDYHHVPVQRGSRYIGRQEMAFKGFNNDYIEACTRCIDPRLPKKVFCPLVNRDIDNVSDRVLKFEGRASYIGE